MGTKVNLEIDFITFVICREVKICEKSQKSPLLAQVIKLSLSDDFDYVDKQCVQVIFIIH